MPFFSTPRGPREQRSLFGEILDWMLAPLLLLWPMSVLLTWLVAQGISNRPYDRDLTTMTHALAQQVTLDPGSAGRPAARFTLPPTAAEMLRGDASDRVFFQVLGLRGELLAGDAQLPTPPDDDITATSDAMRFRDDMVHGEPVRVAALWVTPTAAGSINPPPALALVQVAETLGKRSQLAAEIIKGVILPQFVILPLAVLLVWLALARGIAPLNELQQRIRSRESNDLSPIDERDAPEEVAPLVLAINDLLHRLDQSIGTQKRFLADAAHQLKTPLAGLRTQAELAQREIDAASGDPEVLKSALTKSLQQIAYASQRAAHMVNQLLALARADDKESVQRQQPVLLAGIAADTVRQFVPRALDKRIDLGYEGPEPAGALMRVMGQPVLLREMLRNLVDNALQYTPEGGIVTVRVIEDIEGGSVLLQVEDNGPGIPPEERELVFQPFYRVLGTNVDGSGLGLAIVREIALRHDAPIALEDHQPGSRFSLRFAAAPTPA